MLTRPARSLAVTLALLAAGAGIAQATEPTRPTPARASSAPVSMATVVCPPLAPATASVRSRLSVGVPASGASRGATGAVTIAPADGSGQPGTVPVSAPGAVATISAIPAAGPMRIDATGRLAAGLTAEEVSLGEDGPTRGLAALRCTPPGGEAWYVGAATTLDATSTLTLTNLDDRAATADLDLAGPEGAVAASGARGVRVAARTTVTVRLDDVAPDLPVLAVHVRVTSGQLATAVSTVRGDPVTPLGVDWVPPTDGPARAVVVPGVVGDGGRRTLAVFNPGDTDTTVRVRLTTGDASFVPTGLDSVAVPASSIASVDIGRALGQAYGAVTVTSAGPPVLAAVGSTEQAAGSLVADFAWAAAQPALSGPAALPDMTSPPGTRTSLVLSAPEQAATVRVVPLSSVAGARSPITVRVPSGRSVIVDLPAVLHRADAPVTLIPAGGPVYAARWITEDAAGGPLATWLPVRTAPLSERVPPVRFDPQAATG